MTVTVAAWDADPITLETMHPKHMCKPSVLAGQRAHFAPRDLIVECPTCCRRWWPTKHDGRICGCGWECLNPPASGSPRGSTNG